MKKTILWTLLAALSFAAVAQDAETLARSITVKWPPTGLVVGSISLQGEYAISSKSSLTAKIGLPSGANYTVEYDGNDADFDLKATSFMAGYRMYLSKKQ